MNQNSVRRNLFHGNLSRRPASAGPPNGAVPQNHNGLSNRPSHRLKSTSSDSGPHTRPFKSVETKDIVVRDKNGSYKLEIPTLPQALVGEDGEELAELAPEDGGFDSSDLTGRDKEKILNMVHESLRRKAASLDDDNWMFEPEKDSISN
ncbi:Pc12g04450 [Penicillium rubens Wisconsin 54-1255]|uniref:Pc12g04450 protein n=1 Tax=Penicillium rubens (strain ATCC 28089 / DSM 1075 / NRRL 1951 / Wisconsin 54-1255) TaxID=500485 RepID=B6GXW8_PENRW|nr:Pc12g04450 [Penicillium rubens Wisconsin 54-1255]